VLENAHFRPRIHQISFGGRAPPGPLGELTALPRPLAVSEEGGAGDGNEREVERKGTSGSKEKREIKGKGGILGIME